MLISRKDLIIEKYTILTARLNDTGYFSEELFPSLDEIDVADAIFFFQLSFPDSTKYIEAIEELLLCHNVKLKPSQKKEVIEIILPFLELFKNIT
jgi:hypothetical protein